MDIAIIVRRIMAPISINVLFKVHDFTPTWPIIAPPIPRPVIDTGRIRQSRNISFSAKPDIPLFISFWPLRSLFL